ncbi:membrane protein [Vibrio metoecus]|uniref:Membrane protein n=1 Tax=Vibrio metoecus TaxID=1481663 RepID=A0A0Q0JN00_VIBMT|nr:membrane protein [Vibrio metoecus]
MKKFLAFIVLSNLIAVACVYLFELSFGYLKIAFLKDYAFYSMLITSGARGYFFTFSGHGVGYSDPSNVAGVAASSLIDNDSAKKTVVTRLESTGLGHRFLIASLLPLIFCFIV